MPDNGADFLGQGWSFPMRISSRGGISLSRHDQDIEEAIRIILSTAKGERHMRPEFGCGIHDLVFAPNNATTAGLADYHVKQALGQWEPRIEVTDVQIDVDSVEGNLLLINIRYVIRATNEERNLVYPFYLIRSE
jgi:phage baseplate assembly protein W